MKVASRLSHQLPMEEGAGWIDGQCVIVGSPWP
jgi:hypothetical protein